MNHTHARRLISMYLYISNRKIHAHRRGFWVSIALITYSFFLSPHLSLSFHYTQQAFNEWKKISFGLYMRLCVYIMPAFIQHNFFILYFLSTFLFSTYFTVQFSSSDRTHAREERFRDYWEISLNFLFRVWLLYHFFLLKVSERQQFHRTFGSFSLPSFF